MVIITGTDIITGMAIATGIMITDTVTDLLAGILLQDTIQTGTEGLNIAGLRE